MCTWRSCAKMEQKPESVLAKAGFLLVSIKSLSSHTDGISSSTSSSVGAGEAGRRDCRAGEAQDPSGSLPGLCPLLGKHLYKFSSLPLKKQHVFCLLASFHRSCHLPHCNSDTGTGGYQCLGLFPLHAVHQQAYCRV